MFKLATERKRWIGVSAPVSAALPLPPRLPGLKACDDPVDVAQQWREQLEMRWNLLERP